MLLEVKPYQETLHAGACGPASLKIVLSYWNVEKSENELMQLCGTHPTEGTSDENIAKAARQLGFDAYVIRDSSFKELADWLEKRIPVIVEWFTNGRPDAGLSDTADGHYSVVVGLDEEHIHLMDPEIGGVRTISRTSFLKVWFDFEGEYIKTPDQLLLRTFIAVLPKGK